MARNIASTSVDFNDDDYRSDNVIDLQIYQWAKRFKALSPQEQRMELFRNRVRGYPSASAAFKRPSRPRPAGAAAPDIHDQIRGRELELIKAAANSGFSWPPAKGDKVRCPFPGHLDEDPSWRWDAAKCCYFCTCPPGGGSAIDAVMQLRGLDFSDAANWAREQLGLAGSKRENITLELYAEKKHLPLDFLRSLGLKTIPSPWGHDQQVLAPTACRTI